MPEFHNQIGTNYGTINQAGRDINQAGGDLTVSNVEALAAASELREALAQAGLSPEVGRVAGRELDDVESELRSPQPNKERMAARLESLTAILKSAGALAATGVALVGPIGVLAGFLGPLGHAALELTRR